MIHESDIEPRLPLSEAARLAGVHPATLRRAAHSGGLRTEQRNGRYYIVRSELERWLTHPTCTPNQT